METGTYVYYNFDSIWSNKEQDSKLSKIACFKTNWAFFSPNELTHLTYFLFNIIIW
jgi:hypothetical protein